MKLLLDFDETLVSSASEILLILNKINAIEDNPITLDEVLKCRNRVDFYNRFFHLEQFTKDEFLYLFSKIREDLMQTKTYIDLFSLNPVIYEIAIRAQESNIYKNLSIISYRDEKSIKMILNSLGIARIFDKIYTIPYGCSKNSFIDEESVLIDDNYQNICNLPKMCYGIHYKKPIDFELWDQGERRGIDKCSIIAGEFKVK